MLCFLLGVKGRFTRHECTVLFTNISHRTWPRALTHPGKQTSEDIEFLVHYLRDVVGTFPTPHRQRSGFRCPTRQGV